MCGGEGWGDVHSLAIHLLDELDLRGRGVDAECEDGVRRREVQGVAEGVAALLFEEDEVEERTGDRLGRGELELDAVWKRDRGGAGCEQSIHFAAATALRRIREGAEECHGARGGLPHHGDQSITGRLRRVSMDARWACHAPVESVGCRRVR